MRVSPFLFPMPHITLEVFKVACDWNSWVSLLQGETIDRCNASGVEFVKKNVLCVRCLSFLQKGKENSREVAL